MPPPPATPWSRAPSRPVPSRRPSPTTSTEATASPKSSKQAPHAIASLTRSSGAPSRVAGEVDGVLLVLAETEVGQPGQEEICPVVRGQALPDHSETVLAPGEDVKLRRT